MNKQQPISAAVVAMVAALVLASAGTLLANGQAFFVWWSFIVGHVLNNVRGLLP